MKVCVHFRDKLIPFWAICHIYWSVSLSIFKQHRVDTYSVFPSAHFKALLSSRIAVLRLSCALRCYDCETFSWVRTCKSATTFIFEFRLCSVIKKLWKCAVQFYPPKSERKRQKNMQCPSPYWSTPLTPEDRRINSKKKNFSNSFLHRFRKLFAGNFCKKGF